MLLSSYCFRIVFRLLIATQQQQHLQAETELCSLVVVVVVAAASSSLLALTHRHTVTLTLTHANLRFAWLWPLARETQKKRENMQFCNNNNNSLLSTYFHCIYNPVFALHFGCASDLPPLPLVLRRYAHFTLSAPEMSELNCGYL